MAEPDVTSTQREAVWTVLLVLGARQTDRDDFDVNWPGCHEFRFGGLLGAGGKVWADWSPHDRTRSFRVTCYPEDRTPERESLVTFANDHLRAIDGEVPEPEPEVPSFDSVAVDSAGFVSIDGASARDSIAIVVGMRLYTRHRVQGEDRRALGNAALRWLGDHVPPTALAVIEHIQAGGRVRWWVAYDEEEPGPDGSSQQWLTIHEGFHDDLVAALRRVHPATPQWGLQTVEA